MWATLHDDGRVTDIGFAQVEGRNVEIDAHPGIPTPGARMILDPENPRCVVVDEAHVAALAKVAAEDAVVALELKRITADSLGLKDAEARYSAEIASALSAIDAAKGG